MPLSRWIPGFTTLRHYQPDWLGHDLFAGLSLVAVMVPAGMAYASAAGLPPITGIYATIGPLAVYAVFGPSRILVLGPDSALVALIATTVLPLAGGDSRRAISLAALLPLLVGAVCVLGSVARLGRVADFVSGPMRYGYVNGPALIVVASRLPKLFGFSISGGARAFAISVAGDQPPPAYLGTQQSNNAVTANSVTGTRSVYSVTSSNTMPPPQGTMQVLYKFVTGGRAYCFQYDRHPGDPDRTAQFDEMITQTVIFHPATAPSSPPAAGDAPNVA